MDIGIYARDDYYFNYRNADFKALMAKAEATVDENARNALLAEAQKKLAADAVNVFLFQLAKHGVWDPTSSVCGKTARCGPTTSPRCIGNRAIYTAVVLSPTLRPSSRLALAHARLAGVTTGVGDRDV